MILLEILLQVAETLIFKFYAFKSTVIKIYIRLPNKLRDFLNLIFGGINVSKI